MVIRLETIVPPWSTAEEGYVHCQGEQQNGPQLFMSCAALTHPAGTRSSLPVACTSAHGACACTPPWPAAGPVQETMMWHLH